MLYYISNFEIVPEILMSLTQHYNILTFQTTTAVIEAETLLKERFRVSIMPLPSELTAGCGLAIRFSDADETAIIEVLHGTNLACRLYRMQTKKIDGKRPIRLIADIVPAT